MRAIDALASLGTPRKGKPAAVDPVAAREAIRPAFTDARAEVRSSAARAWAALAGPADVGELRTILGSDPSPEARRAAANALGQLRAWDGVGELVTALDDDDRIVRQCAFTGVYRMTGAKFQYDVDDRVDARRATVSAIRRMIPNMKPAHDEYMRRYRKD